MMLARHVPAAFSLVSVLALGCTPSITIDAPDIEVTQPALQFPLAPVNMPPGTTVTATYDLVTNKLGASNNPDAGTLKNIQRLQVTRVVLRIPRTDAGVEDFSRAGITDFSFLYSLTVVATNPPSTVLPNPPVVPIVDYQASDVGVGVELQMPVDPPVDLLPLWGRTVLRLTITAAGDLPKVWWSADVVFSLSLRMTQ
jgi:hypothetical protein